MAKYKLKAKLDSFVLEIEGNLKVGAKDVSLFTMREPTGRDIKIVNSIEDEIENNATLIGNLTGHTPEDIMGLPIHIFEALVEGLGSFQSSKETTS